MSLEPVDAPEGADEEGLVSGGARAVGRTHAGSLWSFHPDGFAVVMRNGFSASDLGAALEAIYSRADPPDAIVFVEGVDLEHFDRSVLTFYERDRRRMPRRVGVVARRALTKMVVRATALGFRAFTGVSLTLHGELAEALRG